LQPIAQGLQAEFGTTGAEAGRGLALRIDHGTQYTADDMYRPTMPSLERASAGVVSQQFH
jgi:hypothetical protein